MAFSSGAQRDLYYGREDSFGSGYTDTGTTSFVAVELRNTEDSLNLTRDSFVSNERRGDRGIHDTRLGNKQPGGDISFEFSYEDFDDLLSAALCSTYTPASEELSASWLAPFTDLEVDVSVNATAKTYTRASGSWLDDGMKVGDTITITGLTTSDDNIEAKITALTATVITFGNTTASLVDIAVGEEQPGTFNTDSTQIKKGTTVSSFIFEKIFSDIETYQKYTGSIINGLSLDVSTNSMVTGTFSILCKDAANNDSSEYHTNTPSGASSDNRPFDSFTGYLLEDGSANNVSTSLSLTLDNGFERNFVLMSDTCPQMTSGKSNVTGSITYYFENADLYDKFVGESESSLELSLQDDDGNAYNIELPRIKYTSADNPVNSDGAIIVTMNFQALDDDETTKGNMVIRKQPKLDIA